MQIGATGKRNQILLKTNLFSSDVRGLIHDLGWVLEYPEIQQTAPGFGDKQSQAAVGTQTSKNLSQLSDTDFSQDSQSQNSMYKRYLATKPFPMFKADRSRLVTSRRGAIGKWCTNIEYLKTIFRATKWSNKEIWHVVEDCTIATRRIW